MKCNYCNENTKCVLYVIERKDKKQTVMQGWCYLCVKAFCQGINLGSDKNPVTSIIPKFKEIENE
jgi:hypothetical protein